MPTCARGHRPYHQSLLAPAKQASYVLLALLLCQLRAS